MPSLMQPIRSRIQALGAKRHNQAFKSFLWMLTGQGLGYLFQAAYFVLLTRLLGPLEYGIFAGAFAFTSLLAPYSTLGMGTLFLRYAGGEPELVPVYWGNILMASVGLNAILLPLLTLLAHHLLNPSSAQLVLLAAFANCFCAQLVGECARIFQAAERMQVTAALNLSTNALRVLAVVLLLVSLHRATAWQWTLASVSVSFLSVVAAVAAVLRVYGLPHFRFSLLRQRALEGFGFSFATSSSSVYNDVDKSMLSHFNMNRENGIYTTAYRIIDFATMPMFALREATIPQMFRLARNGVEPATEMGFVLLRRSLILSGTMFVLLVVTAPLLPSVIGHSFAQSVAAVRWLAFIPVLRSVHQMIGSVLLSCGYQKYRTTNQLLTAGFNFLLNLWLIPHNGWLGAAWASLATDAMLALLNIVALQIMRRKLRGKAVLVEAA